MARSLALCLLFACGKAGVVTGGEITHEWTLNAKQRDLVEFALATEACPEIEDQLGTTCTIDTIRESMRIFRLVWTADGKIDARVKFDQE